MRRVRRSAAVAGALVALALTLAACGGDDDEPATTTPPPPVETPGGGAAPPGAAGLPPGIAECLAEQGYDVEPSEIHSVPQEVLAGCFQELHGGGGGL